MNNTPQWRKDLREMLYCIEPDVERYFETQIAQAEESGFTKGFHASHEHDEGIQLLVEQARREGAEEMKKKCLECVPENLLIGFTEIRNSISSL